MEKHIRNYIKDIIYGANDGIVTTFAIIAGVAGASLSHTTILIVGFASLLADGFSMAASNYLGTKSENQAHGIVHDRSEALGAALWTLVSFVVAGVIPLLPYAFTHSDAHVFGWAVAATAIALFGIGSMRTYVTKQPVLRSGLEMLIVGGIASFIAYYVGALLKGLAG